MGITLSWQSYPRRARAAAVIVAAISSGVVLAPGARAADDDSTLQEIIVTSQKRSENLETVPMSITALTAATLQSAGVDSFVDYATKIPNLTFSTGNNYGAVNSRGITVNLDGGNISDQVVSSRDALGASVEEVKEFQVLSNNYNAEYGQAGNVILNVITKSGTNAYHGDAHAYFRGRNMGASDFFYNQTACDPTGTGAGSCDNKADAGFPDSRAPFFKHEEGFTAGGPFVKDRLFWFASLERSAQALPETLTPFGVSTTTSVPATVSRTSPSSEGLGGPFEGPPSRPGARASISPRRRTRGPITGRSAPSTGPAWVAVDSADRAVMSPRA